MANCGLYWVKLKQAKPVYDPDAFECETLSDEIDYAVGPLPLPDADAGDAILLDTLAVGHEHGERLRKIAERLRYLDWLAAYSMPDAPVCRPF